MNNISIPNRKCQFFVAHKFGEANFRKAIREAFKGTGLKPFYADDEISQTNILEKVEREIFRTRFGIYDITDINANVCIELGIAIRMRKRRYIIAKKGSKIPSDLEGLDRIEYKNYKGLVEELREKVVIEELKRFYSHLHKHSITV